MISAEARTHVGIALLCTGLSACGTSDAVDDTGATKKAQQATPAVRIEKIAAPELAERLPMFQKRAEHAASVALSADRLQELVELFELAESGEASGRTQARARRSFAQEADSLRALEHIATEHTEAFLRAHAVYALGERASPASEPILLKRCKYELDASTRVEVAASLCKLRNFSAAIWIRTSVENSASPFRERAGVLSVAICKQEAALIAKFGGPDFSTIDAPSWEELGKGCRALERAWDSGADFSLAELAAARAKARDVDGGSATPSFAPFDPESEAKLLDARVAQLFVQLEGFQLRPVDDARFILTRMGARAVPELGPALLAAEPYLRNHSLEVVRDLGPKASTLVEGVRALLGDRLSRALACRTLGRIGHRESIQIVVSFLGDADPEMRTAAAAALGPMGATSAKPQLERIARDESASMDLRVAAAASLAIFELERPWAQWLREAKDSGRYHGPAVQEILDRVEARRRARESAFR